MFSGLWEILTVYLKSLSGDLVELYVAWQYKRISEIGNVFWHRPLGYQGWRSSKFVQKWAINRATEAFPVCSLLLDTCRWLEHYALSHQPTINTVIRHLHMSQCCLTCPLDLNTKIKATATLALFAPVSLYLHPDYVWVPYATVVHLFPRKYRDQMSQNNSHERDQAEGEKEKQIRSQQMQEILPRLFLGEFVPPSYN